MIDYDRSITEQSVSNQNDLRTEFWNDIRGDKPKIDDKPHVTETIQESMEMQMGSQRGKTSRFRRTISRSTITRRSIR